MSIKLLMLTSSLECGGAETHVCALARSLAERGHRVTVASAGGSLAAELRGAGISHRKLPLNRKNPISLLYCHLALKSLMRRERYDLIHAHARISARIAAPLAKKRGIPLVTTAHARFRSTGWRRRSSRWGERVISVSEDLKQYLIEEYRYPSDHIRVIPNGIDTDHFAPPTAPSDGPLRLLFLSRLDRDCSRSAFLLCHMAEELKMRCPSLEIRIGGGGDALPALRRLVDSVNRRAEAPFLFLCGTVSDPLPLYQAAHGVIGVSRVALEAMSCGVPVILAGNEGMIGLLEPHRLNEACATNFCCRGSQPLRKEELKREVLRLISLTREERSRLGATLSEYIRQRHSLAVMTDGVEDFYGEVLSMRPAREPAQAVLCGYYGYGNVGDDALLSAAIRRAAAQYPDHTLSALTRNGKKDVPRFGIRCVSRLNPFALRRELRHAKLLILGGGTLLQDQTSLRSLCYYVWILRYAHRRGLRIELWGNGLGVPRTEKGESLIAAALRYCHRIGLRDNPSLAFALSHLPEEGRGRLILEPDLALGTEPAPSSRIDFLCRHYRLKPTSDGFGIVTVRGGIGQGYLKILISWLVMLRGERIRLLFVPMHPEEDGRLCRRLAAMFGAKPAVGLSPSDLVGLMSRARIVCGMRLHSLIFAASAGTPFVGFGSDPKIEAFCRENGGVFFTDLY